MKRRILPLIFMFAGACTVCVGIYIYSNTLAFLGRSKAATGTVVEIVVSTTDRPGKKARTTQRPLIEFRTENGEPTRFKSELGTKNSSYSVGDTVPVLYDPADPTEARIDSFLTKYGLETLLSGLGTIFLAIGLIAFVRA